MNAWGYILIGGIFETLWAVCLKMTNGFTDNIWLIPTLVFIATSTLLLNKGLVMKVPAGTGYSVWVGIGAIGSLIVGVVFLSDHLKLIHYICLAVLIIGIIGMQIEENRVKAQEAAEHVAQEEDP